MTVRSSWNLSKRNSNFLGNLQPGRNGPAGATPDFKILYSFDMDHDRAAAGRQIPAVAGAENSPAVVKPSRPPGCAPQSGLRARQPRQGTRIARQEADPHSRTGRRGDRPARRRDSVFLQMHNEVCRRIRVQARGRGCVTPPGLPGLFLGLEPRRRRRDEGAGRNPRVFPANWPQKIKPTQITSIVQSLIDSGPHPGWIEGTDI